MTDPTPEQIEKTTKRGFDLSARLKNRGLRKGSITLYLDEEKGPELGWAYDMYDQMGNIVGRAREGALGMLDAASADKAMAEAENELAIAKRDAMRAAATSVGGEPDLVEEPELKDIGEIDKQIDALKAEAERLTEELTKTGLVVTVKAVPPIIQKDQHRKAKEMMKITSKNIPDEQEDEFYDLESALLMSVIVQTITDNESGEVISEIELSDAVEMVGYLPRGQKQRLDNLLNTIQFTDAISRQIESQEDFS